MTEKYLRNGKKVNLIQTMENGRHLVSDFFVCYGYEGEEYEEAEENFGLYFVTELFDKPPTGVLAEEIVELNVRKDELRLEIEQLREDIRNNQALYSKTIDRLSKIDELKNVLDFIDGKITHYVIKQDWGVPKIVSFEDTRTDEGRHGARYKLLSLFGVSGKNLFWELNNYNDGSGNYKVVAPCLSYEEAIEVIKKEFGLIIEKAANESKSASETLIERAEEYGIPIPDWYIQRYKDQLVEGQEKKVKSIESDLLKAKEELARRKTP